MLGRLATNSAPLTTSSPLGDFNIHVKDNDDTGELLDILANRSLLQHVNSTTHRQRHTLHLIITRDNQDMHVLSINPPLLSDHALTVADHACQHCASPSLNQHFVKLEIEVILTSTRLLLTLSGRIWRQTRLTTSTQGSINTTQL